MTGVPFSGSYDPADVVFLMKPVLLPPTDVLEKERLIQSGRRHYSEMLSAEPAPGRLYLELFERAFAANQARFAADIARLAKALAQNRTAEPQAIVSFARAGTPVGVLLARALGRLGRAATHYSISIIRDRGIDRVALDWILQRHPPEALVFVDGWTGKGAIAGELARTLDALADGGPRLAPDLVAVADLAGVATLAATEEDYLIPSAILNAVVSGLVSRSVLNDSVVGPGDFHACVYYGHLAPYDQSRSFIERLMPALTAALADPAVAPADWPPAQRRRLAERSERFVGALMARHATHDRNRIKPGIGESTRSLLRRVPDRLYLQSLDGADVAHLRHLAEDRAVAVSVDPALPYRAAVVIRSLGAD